MLCTCVRLMTLDDDKKRKMPLVHDHWLTLSAFHIPGTSVVVSIADRIWINQRDGCKRNAEPESILPAVVRSIKDKLLVIYLSL